MARTVKHFHLQRINGTELRVVADIDVGVLPIIQEEEAVIRGYMSHGYWRQSLVTLFILQNLEPLSRQLSRGATLPPGGFAALDQRPVINVYDQADLSSCHVFVNQDAMQKEGYWDDTLAIRGLLAHEHAHPLVENETVRASRDLKLAVSPQSLIETGGHPRDQLDRVGGIISELARQLCLYAPREIFTNELAITHGFQDALLHLNRRNVSNAQRSLVGRANLRGLLQHELVQGKRTARNVGQLLLIGDLQGCLNLSLETAPFYRAGMNSEVRELETVLEQAVFPHLEPEVAHTYWALRDLYIALRADWTPADLAVWSRNVLQVLTETLRQKHFVLHYQVHVIPD